MLIFNDTEMESKNVVYDNTLIEINSLFPLEEIYANIIGHVPMSEDQVRVHMYFNGNGQTKTESEAGDNPEFAYGRGIYMNEDAQHTAEEQAVQTMEYRQPLFRAFEQYGYGNETEGYSFQSIPFDFSSEKHLELLRRHILLAKGILPTLLAEKETPLQDLQKMSKAGKNLYRDYGPGSVCRQNPIPSKEDIEFYETLTEYEKRMILSWRVHPLDALNMAKEKRQANPNYLFDLRDYEHTYNPVRAKTVPAELHTRFENAFQEEFHFVPKVMDEYILGWMAATGKETFTDDQIKEITKTFNRKAVGVSYYKYKDVEGRDVNVTAASSKDPVMLYLSSKLQLGNMDAQLLRAIASHVTMENLHSFESRGLSEYLSKRNDIKVADFVQLLESDGKTFSTAGSYCPEDIILHLKQFNPAKSAKELFDEMRYEKANSDRRNYEARDPYYHFSNNVTAIRGRHTVVEQGDLRIRILDPNDLDNFLIGYSTHCCQHWGGAGSTCVQKYTQDPFAAGLVIEEKKSGKILAQSFIWTDESKDCLVFDNIEYLSDNNAHLLVNIIEAWIEAMPYSDVRIGMGCVETAGSAWGGIGRDFDDKKDAKVKMPTVINNSHVYSDYHEMKGHGGARIMKAIDGRSHTAKMIRYTVNHNNVRVLTAPDEPTIYDELARPEFAFMLNDCSSSIEDRLNLAREFNDNPSPELQRRVVEKCPEAIIRLQNPDPELQMQIWERYPNIAKQIQNPCRDLQIAILAVDAEYIRNCSSEIPEDILNDVLARNGLLLEYIEHPTIANCQSALSNSGYAFYYVPEHLLTEDLKRVAVSTSPKVVTLLDEPSPELQRIAVQADPAVSLLIQNPSEETQVTAVRTRPDLVLRMKNPCYEAIRAAVEMCPGLIAKYQYQYPELRMVAITGNPFVAKELRNLTVEEYGYAISLNPGVQRFVKAPAQEMTFDPVAEDDLGIE